ncbi:MAG: S1 family peptidase [Firmicutes bacterium]|nr:S1 family peptidase [Bacillota bacterium]
MEKVFKALNVHRHNLLSLENVVGVGVGYKETGGKKTEQLAVTVLVKKKVAPQRLNSTHCVPQMLSGTVTDVIEIGEVTLLSRLDRLRPAQPGMSIGHYRITAGTFGAVVKDKKTGQPLILSNNHVLANITNGKDGRAQIGDPVYQPGKYDGGTSEDTIARLERFVPIYHDWSPITCAYAQAVERSFNFWLRKIKPDYEIRFFKKADAENLVDAAVARPTDGASISEEIMELGRVQGITEPQVGMKVLKSGRTSGVTSGEIRVLKASIKVLMGDVGFALFSDQFVTSPMGQPGDSGSLVLTEDMKAVGLLAAGSDSATICGRIQNVLDLLRISL